MNIALLVEPHQVAKALRSIESIQETGLPEGSALHVFVADEATAKNFQNVAEVPAILHVFNDPGESSRFPLVENLLFAWAMQTLNNDQNTLILEPGTAPENAEQIDALNDEYNNSGCDVLCYADHTHFAPRYGIFPTGFWDKSTCVRYLFGKGTPSYTEKLQHEIGPINVSTVILQFRILASPEETTVIATPEPAKKKGVKKTRMKTRGRAPVT